MSQNELQKYVFQTDMNESNENEYISLGSNNVRLSDTNNNSYSTGWLNFSGVALANSSNSNKQICLNQSYLTVPFGAVMHLQNGEYSFGPVGTAAVSGGTAGTASTFDKANLKALGVKAYHHILDSIKLTFSNRVIMMGSSYHNIYINEKLKKMNSEQQRLMGDLANITYDDHESYTVDPAKLLEYNNNITPANGAVNEAHLKRMSRTNFDLAHTQGGVTGIFGTTTDLDSYESGFIAAYAGGEKLVSVNGVLQTPTNAGAVIDTLVFEFIGLIPMAYVSEFFEQVPSLASLSNLDMRILTNLSPNNSWQIEYDIPTLASPNYVVKNVSSNQSIGNCCPFLVSDGNYEGRDGLVMYPKLGIKAAIPAIPEVLQHGAIEDGSTPKVVVIPANPGSPAVAAVAAVLPATGPKLRVTPFIGYYTASELNNQSVVAGKMIAKPSSNYSCQLHIPTVAYTPELYQQITSHPSKQIRFNDFLIDTTLVNRAGGSKVSLQIMHSAAMLRKMYIIPFFSSEGLATATDVRQSLISSCPNTSSLARLSEFQVSTASVAMYPEQRQLNHDFYINANLVSQAEFNGNSFLSEFVSGVVSYSSYKKCMNTYVIDMHNKLNEDQDNIISNVQLQFKINMAPSVRYNFLVISEFQSTGNISRMTGDFLAN